MASASSLGDPLVSCESNTVQLNSTLLCALTVQVGFVGFGRPVGSAHDLQPQAFTSRINFDLKSVLGTVTELSPPLASEFTFNFVAGAC